MPTFVGSLSLDPGWSSIEALYPFETSVGDQQKTLFGAPVTWRSDTDAYTACRMQLSQIHSNEAIATADIDQRRRAALGQAFQQAGQNFQNAMKQPQQIQVITPTRNYFGMTGAKRWGSQPGSQIPTRRPRKHAVAGLEADEWFRPAAALFWAQTKRRRQTMKSILCASLLIVLMSSAYAASLPGDSAEGSACSTPTA